MENIEKRNCFIYVQNSTNDTFRDNLISSLSSALPLFDVRRVGSVDELPECLNYLDRALVWLDGSHNNYFEQSEEKRFEIGKRIEDISANPNTRKIGFLEVNKDDQFLDYEPTDFANNKFTRNAQIPFSSVYRVITNSALNFNDFLREIRNGFCIDLARDAENYRIVGGDRGHQLDDIHSSFLVRNLNDLGIKNQEQIPRAFYRFGNAYKKKFRKTLTYKNGLFVEE